MNSNKNVLTKDPLIYRTYSRLKQNGQRESIAEIYQRVIDGFFSKYSFTEQEKTLIKYNFSNGFSYPSGRIMWVGGTEWIRKNPEGAYNCIGLRLEDIEVFGLSFFLLMAGCGVGNAFTLEDIKNFNVKYPPQNSAVFQTYTIIDDIGSLYHPQNNNKTSVILSNELLEIVVGDSREGWADALTALLKLLRTCKDIKNIVVDLRKVRPKGLPIKGFGGVSNPDYLGVMFEKILLCLQEYAQKPIDSYIIELIFDEAALATVSGSVRRSARISQGSPNDIVFSNLKKNLWIQENGEWKIDPKRNSFRMANHTVVFNNVPTYDDWCKSFLSQFETGEGALQYAPMALYRANIDILNSKEEYIDACKNNNYIEYIKQHIPENESEAVKNHRLKRYELNPCLTADTWIQTEQGAKQIKDLIKKPFNVFINGILYSSTDRGFFFNGIKPVYKLTTKEGYSIKLTKNHKLLKRDNTWCELRDIKVGDKLQLNDNFDVEWDGDGTYTEGFTIIENDLPYDDITVENKSSDFYQGFIDALVTVHSGSHNKLVRIKGYSKNKLLLFQRMFLRLGYFSFIENNVLYVKYSILYYLKYRQANYVATVKSIEFYGIEPVYDCTIENIHCFEANGFISHNCAEVIGHNFVCNLGEVQLNTLDVKNEDAIDDAFRASALMTTSLLADKFNQKVLQESRDIDPIIGVSFTGLFDFFVNYFGREYLVYWQNDRCGYPHILDKEIYFLKRWKQVVKDTVYDYCQRNNLKTPNRYTLVKPSGSLSLISGASCGWHPPKYWQYIRRMTFRRNDPIALACIDYGYNVVPSQSCIDDSGNLLNDPFDPKVTEWLVEIPVRVPYYELTDGINVEFSAIAQLKFYHIVNKYYSTHTTSATIEFKKEEIEAMSKYMTENLFDMEYISFATLPRFDSNLIYPRMPFEPINDSVYEQMVSKIKKENNFYDFLYKYSQDLNYESERGTNPCDSISCEIFK